jgi:hypothetical protein
MVKNINYVIDENELTITIDLTQNFGFSKSGKTQVIASTEGFLRFDEIQGLMLNLNLNKKA